MCRVSPRPGARWPFRVMAHLSQVSTALMGHRHGDADVPFHAASSGPTAASHFCPLHWRLRGWESLGCSYYGKLHVCAAPLPSSFSQCMCFGQPVGNKAVKSSPLSPLLPLSSAQRKKNKLCAGMHSGRPGIADGPCLQPGSLDPGPGSRSEGNR